jgi:hypothetical protein
MRRVAKQVAGNQSAAVIEAGGREARLSAACRPMQHRVSFFIVKPTPV